MLIGFVSLAANLDEEPGLGYLVYAGLLFLTCSFAGTKR
jgi:hypothetical protein